MDAEGQVGSVYSGGRLADMEKWRIAGWVAVVFLLLATFPGHYQPIRTGLDPSYQYGLNFLANSDQVFGRDVAFTFGPLGYLLIPLDIGNNLVESILLRLLVHALFAACLVHLARLAAGALPVAGWIMSNPVDPAVD